MIGRPPPFRSNRLARFNSHIGREPPDVLRPAQFGARIQKRRRARRNSLTETVRQIGAPDRSRWPRRPIA